ncbi:hypothetical protein IRY61_06260 [Candidatus Saccharibacteria bacterium]|nr:hypothetical protein [Candidatus Saccharibacteria bacterium]
MKKYDSWAENPVIGSEFAPGGVVDMSYAWGHILAARPESDDKITATRVDVMDLRYVDR